jgi:predicted metalloprotease
VLVLLFGGNITGGGGSSGPLDPGSVDEPVPQAPSGSQPGGKVQDNAFEFAKFVSQDTQNMWTKVFQDAGKTYTRAPVVTFTSGTMSGCGPASAQTGPFYCPADHKVYLDLSFFQELSSRFGASGDFADAYVIAHEIGHHVQNQLGQFAARGGNAASVRIELQADCYAGVWGFHANRDRHMIEPGDFEEGLRAAAAIGDDRLQRMSRGYVAPESFTHGSARERAGWLRRGLEAGDPDRCDTSRERLE